MKFLFILYFSIIPLVQCLTDEQTERLKKFHMECFDETKTNPEMILKLTTGKWNVEDISLKKWVHCLLIKNDLMSPEGVFKLDTAMAMVPPKDREMIEDFIDDCLPKRALAPHQIAWDYTKCYHKKAEEPKNKDKNLHYLILFY